TQRLKKIGYLSIAITSLTIIVPILFSSAAFIAKGTVAEPWMNIISVILSAVLLSLSILALILKIDQKRENCIIGRRLNIDVSNEALKLLDNDDSEFDWFYKYVSIMDSSDTENIGDASENNKKEAYRYSLKKLHPGRSDTV